MKKSNIGQITNKDSEGKELKLFYYCYYNIYKSKHKYLYPPSYKVKVSNQCYLVISYFLGD